MNLCALSSPGLTLLARPREQARRALCFACVYIFSDSRQISYLNIHRTDLRQIFTVGRTVAVDDQSEISFSIPRMSSPWQPIFSFIYRIDSLDAGG